MECLMRKVRMMHVIYLIACSCGISQMMHTGENQSFLVAMVVHFMEAKRDAIAAAVVVVR